MGDEEWANSCSDFFNPSSFSTGTQSKRRLSREAATSASCGIDPRTNYRVSDPEEAAESAARARDRITEIVRARAAAQGAKKKGVPTVKRANWRGEAKIKARISRKSERNEAEKMKSKAYRKYKKEQSKKGKENKKK